MAAMLAHGDNPLYPYGPLHATAIKIILVIRIPIARCAKYAQSLLVLGKISKSDGVCGPCYKT